jgi:hypothetical protein
MSRVLPVAIVVLAGAFGALAGAASPDRPTGMVWIVVCGVFLGVCLSAAYQIGHLT